MKKTKIISSLLVIVMLFSILQPLISNAEAQTSIKLINADGENEKILVGEEETFTINVVLANTVSGATALSGFVKYDTSKLDIVNKAESEGVYVINGINSLGDINMVMFDNDTPNLVSFTNMNLTPGTTLRTGIIVPITFKVKKGATGTFDIEFDTVKYTNAKDDDEEVIYPITIGNKVTGTIKTPLQSISLNKTETTVGIGLTDKLTVNYTPADTTDSKTVTWTSSNNGIAKVDSTGTITGVAPGTATITANCNGKTTSCKVTVTAKLQSISLNKTTIELAKTQTAQLEVVYKPANTTDSKDVVWESSNPEVATVDQKGKVTAIKNGTATITATSKVSGISPATCKVNVTSKLQSISLNETNFEMNKGTNKTLTVSYLPADTTDSKKVTWESSDKSIATVDGNGKIIAVAPGTVTITANCNGKIAKATVTVKSPLTGIEINGGNRELLPLQKANLSVTYTPADTTDSKTILWSTSNESVVTVNAEGRIEAKAPGTAKITAKCGEFTSTIEVTVPEVHTERIAFENENVTIEKNKTVSSKIIYYPENTTDDKTVIWSSENENIATVDKEGKIIARSAGTTRIKAQVGDKVAYCDVTVVIPLTGIKLNSNKLEMIKGATQNLQVIYNEEDTTDDKTVTWTSLNENVATVDDNGTVTAKSAGTAIIKAQVGNYVVTCEVNVKVPLTGISIKSDITLLKNQSETLTVTYKPEDTTDDRTVTWSSADESIAKVDSTGKITGMKEGTTKITAKVGEFEEECTVTVKEIKLEGIAISNKIDTLLKGQEAQLEVIYTPENTTDDRTVEWSSSDDSVLTVDENGKLKALKEGTAVITVTSGDFKDSYEVEVKEIPLTGMEIKVDNTTIKEGEEIQLNVEFTPENTTDSKELTYISSDESILTVDENGVIRAIKAGKAVVTVIAENGVKTQIELTVEGTGEASENLTGKTDKESSVNEVASPKTGDMNIALYSILMLVSLLGIVIIIKNRK